MGEVCDCDEFEAATLAMFASGRSLLLDLREQPPSDAVLGAQYRVWIAAHTLQVVLDYAKYGFETKAAYDGLSEARRALAQVEWDEWQATVMAA